MFTREQVKAIAEIIKKYYKSRHYAAAAGIAHDLADYFAKDNERFDREKWMEECGL